MRIALVTSDLNGSAGVPRYVRTLGQALGKQHDVTIFTRFPLEMDLQLCESGIRIIQGAHHYHDVSNGDHGKFDIIHSHDYDYPFVFDVITSHYCELEAAGNVIWNDHLSRFSDSSAHQRGLVRSSRERILFGQRDSGPLITLSNRMKNDFIRHHNVGTENIFVVPSGVDSDKYNARVMASYRSEVRQRYSVSPDEPLILFVGGEWLRKGVAQAIEALSFLRSRVAKLLIVGPGDVRSYRQMAQDMNVADRVVFTGQTIESQALYAAGDVFLLPTLYEPFGLTVLEAMASALPVVVSKHAGAAELLKDGYDGLIINQPKDVAEISSKLDYLLGDRALMRRLGVCARRTASHHGWDIVAQNTESVYQTVSQRRRKSWQV